MMERSSQFWRQRRLLLLVGPSSGGPMLGVSRLGDLQEHWCLAPKRQAVCDPGHLYISRIQKSFRELAP
jgi:hypothetical protein